MQLGPPNLTYKCSTTSHGNSSILESRGQGHESQKQCRHGPLHSSECWLLLVNCCYEIAYVTVNGSEQSLQYTVEKAAHASPPDIIINFIIEVCCIVKILSNYQKAEMTCNCHSKL